MWDVVLLIFLWDKYLRPYCCCHGTDGKLMSASEPASWQLYKSNGNQRSSFCSGRDELSPHREHVHAPGCMDDE